MTEELLPILLHDYGPSGAICLVLLFLRETLKEVKVEVREIREELKPIAPAIVRIEDLERRMDVQERGRHGRVTA